jgi:hypothetical protein
MLCNNILLFQPVDGVAAIGGAPPPVVLGEEVPVAQVDYFYRILAAKGLRIRAKELFYWLKNTYLHSSAPNALCWKK